MLIEDALAIIILLDAFKKLEKDHPIPQVPRVPFLPAWYVPTAKQGTLPCPSK